MPTLGLDSLFYSVMRHRQHADVPVEATVLSVEPGLGLHVPLT